MRLKDLDRSHAERLTALLDEVFALDPSQRAAWQAALGEREPGLAPLLDKLLLAADAAALAPGNDTAAWVEAQIAATAAPPPAQEGRRFGPYRVLRLIGQGGMGSVWLAERADGLFDRRVALKLLHPALFGDAFEERFARERRILAALDHPNIARLLDAGSGEDAQPYLALEYVEGRPLVEWCDERRLSPRARIELFLQVAAAVQHAHQNLVIHRDLKPSNILVTTQGDVRLLDFGIAKLIDEAEGARATELTLVGGRPLTRGYASPEQIAGDPVSTASDVYSLGVVLCELLCGERLRTPSRVVGVADSDPEPLLPSQPRPHPAQAAARGTTPAQLQRALQGDLDNIVAKATAPLPGNRYPTAQALADDLGRYLRGEPVTARPVGRIRRAFKFVRRHRLGVAATAAVAGTMLAATMISLHQARVAERESLRAGAVQEFLLDIFRTNARTQADPQKARSTTAIELLDVGAQRVGQALSASPQAQSEVLDTLAWMYYELGLSERAAELRLRRVALLRQLHGARDPQVADALRLVAIDLADTPRRGETPALLAEAVSILDAAHDKGSALRGRVLIEQARFEKYRSVNRSVEYARQAVAIFERLDLTEETVEARRFVGKALFFQGQLEQARTWQRRTLELATRGTTGEAGLVPLWVELAETEFALDAVEDAERHFEAAAAATARVDGPWHAETVRARVRLAALLHRTSRRQAGRDLFEALRRMVDDGTHPDLAQVRPDVYGLAGAAAIADGLPAVARPLLELDLDDLRRHYPGSDALAAHLLPECERLISIGRFAQAQEILEEAQRVHRDAVGPGADPASDVRYLIHRAQLEVARGDAGRALSLLDSIPPPPAAAPNLAWGGGASAALVRSDALLSLGRSEEALAAAVALLERLRASPALPYHHDLEAEALLRTGLAQRALVRTEAACASLVTALHLRRELEPPTSLWLAANEVQVAHCLLDKGDFAAASQLARQAQPAFGQEPSPGPHVIRPWQELQRRLLAARKSPG